MKIFALSLILLCPLVAQDEKAFIGRWDITGTPAQGAPYPQWMELVEKDGKLGGRLQPRGGAWREIAGGVTVANGHLIIPVAPAGRGAATTWDLTASGTGLAGVEKRGDTEG